MHDVGGRAPPFRVAVVMKGYPRLSETFVVQELLALERRGAVIDIWSLRHPTDKYTHAMHKAVRARVNYLPEYLYLGPWRVFRGVLGALTRPGFASMMATFWRDLRRDPTPNRIRRLGQACVLAREIDPAIGHLHVHFLHTPGSVVRYCALLTGRSFSFSAHARDIWTVADWELAEKIADASWGVTCTRDGHARLTQVSAVDGSDRVHLAYHGLDLSRFPAAPRDRPPADGTDPARPVTIVTVGRAVEKKGFEDLLSALALLKHRAWRLVHIGSGPRLPALKAQAEQFGIAERIEWRGAQPQDAVIGAMRAADIFALTAKEGRDGDRDGLPNVLMEAATQALPLLATRVGGIAEFVEDGVTGRLVEQGDVVAVAQALEALIRSPETRRSLGAAAEARLKTDFSFEAGIDRIELLLRASVAAAPARA